MDPINSTIIIHWDDGQFDHLQNVDYEYNFDDSSTWPSTVGFSFSGMVIVCFLIFAFYLWCIKKWRCRRTGGGHIYRRGMQNQNNNNTNGECHPNSSMLLLILA